MRLIDADKLDVYEMRFRSALELQDYLSAQETIYEKVGKWIPVSERLPEVGRSVLLSVGKGKYPAEGFLKGNGTWAQYRWSANLENVDAWAEMPEPWREVTE